MNEEVEVEAPEVEVEAPEEVEEAIVLPSDEVAFEMPEKFEGKSVEDIAKSYMELEKFKGNKEEPEESYSDLSIEEIQGKLDEYEAAGYDISEQPEEIQGDFAKYEKAFATNGSLSDEEYSELKAQGFDKDTVDTEIANRKEYAEYMENKKVEEVISPLGGGTERLNEVVAWAKENKTEDEIADFNNALGNSPLIAQRAMLKGLYDEYDNFGNGPSDNPIIHTNTPQRVSSKGYASRTELLEDMNHKAYAKDRAFTEAVEAKLAASNTSNW